MKPKIVVIGGGGGGSNVLKCLKNLFYKKKIKSLIGLISTADDGGSTGILKKQYKTSAWGDIGKNILALVNTDKKELNLFTKCLLHRFEEGFLKGHTLRNILMTAFDLLPDCSIECAIKELSILLKINENLRIIPITNLPCSQKLLFANGKKINGQYKIANYPIQKEKKPHIIKLYPQNVTLNKYAKKEIKSSNFVIISPGHFYGTTLSCLAVPDLSKNLKNKIIIVLMPFFNRHKLNQTNNWTTSKYLEVYTKYLNREPDIVICNNNYNIKIKEHSWIIDDYPKTKNIMWISKNLLPNKIKTTKTSKADKIVRSPLSFDKKKLEDILSNIFQNYKQK